MAVLCWVCRLDVFLVLKSATDRLVRLRAALTPNGELLQTISEQHIVLTASQITMADFPFFPSTTKM